jgi:uncharacterized membrane protein
MPFSVRASKQLQIWKPRKIWVKHHLVYTSLTHSVRKCSIFLGFAVWKEHQKNTAERRERRHNDSKKMLRSMDQPGVFVGSAVE